MNKTMFGVLTFAAGAIIGSAVTWKLVQAKYEQIAQEEINSVKEYYGQKFEAETTKTEEETEEFDETEEEYNPDKPLDLYTVKEYLEKIRENGYGAGVNNDPEEEGGVTMVDSPCVIPPTEFGENDEYEQVTLYYHADDVLADDYGNPIECVMNLVGVDPATHFGEYEEDAVHVRNDHLKTYFEILRDERKSTEVKKLDYQLTDGEDDI